MATYVMLGKYSLEGVKGISAKRTDKARAVIKQHGGELKAVYALLGEFDLVWVEVHTDHAAPGGLEDLNAEEPDQAQPQHDH